MCLNFSIMKAIINFSKQKKMDQIRNWFVSLWIKTKKIHFNCFVVVVVFVVKAVSKCILEKNI